VNRSSAEQPLAPLQLHSAANPSLIASACPVERIFSEAAIKE